MKDYTQHLPKYVIIHGAPVDTLSYFEGSTTIRQISDNEFIISVDEYNSIVMDHEVNSLDKTDYYES